MNLDTVNRSLQVKLGGSGAIPCFAQWIEGGSYGTRDVNTNGATAVDIVEVPGVNQTREIDFFTVRNDSGGVVTATLQVKEFSTTYEIWSGTLNDGDTLQYAENRGLCVIDNKGVIKSGYLPITNPNDSAHSANWQAGGPLRVTHGSANQDI